MIEIMETRRIPAMPIGKLGQRRQVVIPKEICENLGLETGDFVEIVQEGSRVVIKPKQVVDPDDVLSPEDEAAVRQGLEDIERGDVRPWSAVKHDLGL
jgi:AbrB family looped-hinge helix DNA binding protein